jgi:hypothetical protein
MCITHIKNFQKNSIAINYVDVTVSLSSHVEKIFKGPTSNLQKYSFSSFLIIKNVDASALHKN